MGRERIINEGEIVPVFAAGTAFSKEIAPIEGHVLKGLWMYYRGAHTTNITTLKTDAEAAVITELQIEVPRKDPLNPGRSLDPIVWNWTPQDLKQLTHIYAGTLPDQDNPTPTTEVHFGKIFIPFTPPKRHTTNYDDWGIPANEINGKIRIRGNYGAVDAIGTGATATTHRVSFSQVVEAPNPVPPRACLMGIQNRIAIESDSLHGPLVIQPGLAQALYFLQLRQDDSSATGLNARRVDGLVTRFKFKMNQVDLVDEFHATLKAKMGVDFSIDAAGLPAGISGHVFSRRGIFGEMPQIGGSTVLALTVDTAEEIPVEFTNVTPGLGDSVQANIVGAMLTAFGRSELGA